MARKRTVQGLARPPLNAGPTAIDEESTPAPTDIGGNGSEIFDGLKMHATPRSNQGPTAPRETKI
jgi:hypothetical protein